MDAQQVQGVCSADARDAQLALAPSRHTYPKVDWTSSFFIASLVAY
jgi:hypothetical protein